jgi:mRNA interferase RelE/StbE
MAKTNWQIVFQKSAYKEYQKLPKKVKSKIDESLEILSISPFNDILKFKKIRGKDNHYRIRVGNYRVVYTPREDTLVIRIIRVGHRKDIYKFF